MAASIFLEVIDIYIYPDDLAGKATLWLWTLRDVVILGAGALFSALALARTSLSFPAVLTALYAFLTIRLEDVSILDFCRRPPPSSCWSPSAMNGGTTVTHDPPGFGNQLYGKGLTS